MNKIVSDIMLLIHEVPFAKLWRATLVFLIGYLVIRLVNRALLLLLPKNQSPNRTSGVIGNMVRYFLSVVLFTLILHELGVSPSVLLGTAGFLTVALGFAAQTSVSNIISGLFLIGEKSFTVGDSIAIEGTHGSVLSIDLLSIKIRTFDNLLVRIPNEMALKAKVINETSFLIRRVDLELRVALAENIDRVQEILLDVTKKIPICLEEPKPFFLIRGMGEGLLTIQFSAWASRINYLQLKNTLQKEIKQAFEEAAIRMPSPRRELEITNKSLHLNETQ